MDSKENYIKDLREDMKKHRDKLIATTDPDLQAMGVAMNAFILSSYDPYVLEDLCLVLSYFISEHLGGEN
jgi:hypothetical protein